MATLSNNFSAGTPGANVTVANSGGGSGNAWSSVTRGTNATVKYDDGGILFATVDKAVARTRWSVGTAAQSVAGRQYIKLDDYPTPSCAIVEFANSAVQLVAAKARVNANGRISVLNTNSSAAWTSRVTLQVGIRYRLEWVLLFDDTLGQFSLNIYEGNSLQAIDGVNAVNQQLGVPGIDLIGFGWLTGVANMPNLHMYDIKVNNTGAPVGPTVIDISSADVSSFVETASLTEDGMTVKEGKEVHTFVETEAVLAMPSLDHTITFGSTCWYEAEGMDSPASWDRMTGDLNTPMDFYHGYSGNTIPTSVNGSAPLKLALATGYSCELNIKTDWPTDTQGLAYWLGRLDYLLYDLQLNAPNMKVHFVLNHEPENDTVNPTSDLGLAKVQSARWRAHVKELAHHIWSYQNPNWTVGLVFAAFNSTLGNNTGKRISKWLPPESWVPPFVGDEFARVVLGADIYPRLNSSGEAVSNYMNADQTMVGQTKTFDDYAAYGYSQFAFSEFGYNCNAITTNMESKVRDNIRGYTNDGHVVPGSLGEYMLNPSHKIVRFSWYERSFASGDDPAAGGYGYLATSTTKMSGYHDLIVMTRSRVTP